MQDKSLSPRYSPKSELPGETVRTSGKDGGAHRRQVRATLSLVSAATRGLGR